MPVVKRLLLTYDGSGYAPICLPPVVVLIRTPYAVTLRMVVEIGDTMQLLKAKIEETLGLSTSRQRLTLTEPRVHEL